MADLDRFGGYKEIKSEATGFFRVEKIGSRWWFITPEGHVFISTGVNHMTSTALKYPDNIHIWKERYGGSQERWICDGVVKDLRSWGFNTIGWTQEIAAKNMAHTPSWSSQEHRWAEIPHCHLIPFADIAMYDRHPVFPDVFSPQFEEYCDYLAREYCVDMGDDPYLIGYFYSDMPAWIGGRHGRYWAEDFDLATPDGQAALGEIAERYYKVIHDSIRRYDPNHLLMGDRYDADGGISDIVLEKAAPTIDVLSVQYYTRFEYMESDLDRWYDMLGKPIFLADSAFLAPTELLKVGPGAKVYVPDQGERGKAYQDFATRAYSKPQIIGWHWCAYIENRTRKSGLKNYKDEPYTDCVSRMREFNEKVYDVAAAASA